MITRIANRTIEVVVEDRGWRGVAADLVPQLKRAVRLTLAHDNAARDNMTSTTILLTDDSRLRALNRDHRGKDKPTDVLSFPAASGQDYLGDIAIAYGVAKRDAEAARKPLSTHAVHLAVHGMLHLLGYDHEEPREAHTMESLETEILAQMGIGDPYRPRRRAA